MKTQTIRITTGRVGMPEKVDVVQSDSGRILSIIIEDMELKDTYSARLYVIKPSGKEIYNNGSINGVAVEVQLAPQMLAETGSAIAQLRISDKSGYVVSSFDILLNIQKSRMSEAAIRSTNEYSALEEALNNIEETTYEAVKEYIEANGLTTGATPAEARQIAQNTVDIAALTASKGTAIICEARGKEIIITDSADAPLGDFNLYGKAEQDGDPTPDVPIEIVNVGHKSRQLFDASKFPTKTQGGATVTNNGDGSFTISESGTLTESFTAYYEYSHEDTLKLLKSGFLSLRNNIVTTPYISVSIITNGSIVGTVYSSVTSGLSTISISQDDLDNETTKLRISVYGGSGLSITGGTIKPMLYQDGDGEWEPFTDKYVVPIKVRGKNKLNTSGLKQTTSNGITYTPVYDKNGMLLYVEASGTATANSYYAINTFDYTEDCYLSGSPEGASTSTYCLLDDVLQKYDYGEGVLINSGSSGKIYCKVTNGVTVNKIRYKPMTRLASITDPTYEPYKENITYLELDEPLRATKDGSVRDKLYLDGTVVRNIAEYICTSSAPWNLYSSSYRLFHVNNLSLLGKSGSTCPSLSTHFPWSKGALLGGLDEHRLSTGDGVNRLYISSSKYSDVDSFKAWLDEEYTNGTPVTVQYQLESPITETLPESEIAKLQSLKTFCPTTILSNSDGGEMEIDYMADTKTYIDNKITEVLTSLAATNAQLL